MKTKQAAKQTCLDLFREVTELERSGRGNTKAWRFAKASLTAALVKYRQAGASHYEMYCLRDLL